MIDKTLQNGLAGLNGQKTNLVLDNYGLNPKQISYEYGRKTNQLSNYRQSRAICVIFSPELYLKYS